MTNTLEPRFDAELERARGAIPTWSMARQQQVIWGVKGRLQSAKRRTSMFVAAAAAVLTLGVGWAVIRQYSEPAPVATIGAERWNLRDGSQIVIESPATIIKKKRESEREILFELEAGAAEFEVVKKPARVFRVNAGAVTVEVMGTSFRVARQQERSRVSVSQGRVIVSWNGGSRELDKGESGTFPPVEALAVSAAPPPPSASLDPVATPRVHEERGAEALFASADKARKDGRPELALGFLKTIVERHPSDPRAPLAAFTRGRVLLESLNRPREAAQSFAKARGLAGRGSALAEDALAREVEAYAAAGEAGLARDRAELYRRIYPKGLRLQQVIRGGGLQDAP